MNISLETAQKIIAAVRTKAEAINKPVTTAIVDAGGYIVALERMDGARPLQPSIATAKAYTGAIMQRPGVMLKKWESNQPGFFSKVAGMGMHPILTAEGAFPIQKDGVLIGGLGVAGGTGPEDHQICLEVLEELGFELDFEQFNSIKK